MHAKGVRFEGAGSEIVSVDGLLVLQSMAF